jgi:hypothetical protein
VLLASRLEENKSKNKGGDLMFTCAVCGDENPKFALPLVKEDGKWMVKHPICAKCRGGLLSEAYAQQKDLRIFSLAGSLREAEARNANAGMFTPFLSAFAREIEARPVVRKNGDKRKINAEAKETARL